MSGDIKRLRPDWDLARMIAKTRGLAMARYWMQAVMVDIRGVDLPNQPERQITTTGESWRRLPWNDFVLLYSQTARFEHDPDNRVPVTMATRIYGDPKKQPGVFGVGTFVKDGVRGWIPVMTLEVEFPEGRSEFSVMPFEVNPEFDFDSNIETAIGDVSLAVNYLTTSDTQLVEVRPEKRALTETQARKQAKTVQNFPWLNEDCPRIILLDPNQHYPGHGRGESVGTHASPIPHQRVGHWATLRSERFSPEKRGTKVWRRPAWIGDREWIHYGSVYRVIDEGPGEAVQP